MAATRYFESIAMHDFLFDGQTSCDLSLIVMALWLCVWLCSGVYTGLSRSQGRRQVKKCRVDTHGDLAEREPIRGLVRSPQGPGAQTLVR